MEIRPNSRCRLGHRKKFQCGFRDDAEHAFRAAHQTREIEPDYILNSLTAGTNNLSGCSDHFKAENMMFCNAVFWGPHTAGIFSDVSADEAVFITCGVRSKHQACLFDGLLKFKGAYARLANCVKIID